MKGNHVRFVPDRIAIAVLLVLLLITVNTERANAFVWSPTDSWKMFDSGSYKYNYAPSSIIEGNVESHFYCSNKVPSVVEDYIYLTQRIDGQWQSKVEVLAPSPTGWDSFHVCDPAVVKGQFSYNSNLYQWAMFFLGEDYTASNELGVAFANDLAGPWIKWSGNPMIPYTANGYWGVGQPSVTSIDGQGRVLLFYTRGDQNSTSILRRELDFSDMSNPIIGPAVTVPKAGLTSGDGSQVIFHSADFVYDVDRDRFIVVRPRHPFDSEWPDFVASELQVATIEGSAIWTGSGTWDVLGHINSSNSGKPRNHNGGIVRNAYGCLPEFDSIRIIYTPSDIGDNWLWSYSLYSQEGKLVSFDFDGDDMVNFNDFADWASYWQQSCNSSPCRYYADYNYDGQVDITDFRFFAEKWLETE